MPQNNAEFFEDIANQAGTLRQKVRAHKTPSEASTAVEMLCYYLREVHNKALVCAQRVEEAPAVAKAAGD